MICLLAEQWVCNTDSRVNFPSCQLADLGSIPHAAVDDIKECMLLDGIQCDPGVQDDINPSTCVLSAARRRFGMDMPKGTGKGSNQWSTQQFFSGGGGGG
jgi:hypothetical protein